MGEFYAKLIIIGKDGLGNDITFNSVLVSIEKKFGIDATTKLKKEITQILINKGYSNLVK